MPDLSVVIISYNTAGMTRECLASVFANAGGLDLEVIVVDNNSADGSADMVAQEFPAAILVRNAENRGFAAANNQGFAIARGAFVLLLNSDTIVLGDVLPACVRHMRDHPDIGALGCRVLNTDRTLQRTCSREPTFLNLALMTLTLDKLRWPRFLGRYAYASWDRRDRRDVEVVSGCYLMIPRRILDEVGPLDEDFFFFGEETDWCRRIRDAGSRCVLAPVGEIIHHGGGSARSLSHRRDRMLTQAVIRFNRKHRGTAYAAAVWALLAVFNASRCLGYACASLVSPRARARAAHFAGVLAGIRDAWPRRQGARS